jgi:hypothetical protein
LRETRLDELPQLFNVLKGEMDFVGPRPERPQIYEHFCRHIRNYDRRFEVSPGLVGYSQLFTPHSSPKRIRVLIDNALLRKKQILLWDAGVVFFAGALVLRHTAVQAAKRLYRDVWLSRVMHRYSEKRETERIAPDGAVVMATPGNTGGQPQRTCDLIDLNDRAFLMRSSVRLASDFPKRFELHIGVPVGRRIEHKRAACTGSLYREIKRPGDEYDYVVVYEPVSPLNYYTVHQYFLKRSFA